MMMKDICYNGAVAPVGRFTTLLAALLLLFSSCLSTGDAPAEVEGKVTSDEGGLPNVVVTDGYQCVVTGEDGSFRMIPHQDARFIYFSTPAGYLPVEEIQVPRFYIPIEGNSSKHYYFSLNKNPRDDTRQLLLVSADPQFHKEENVARYAGVVDDMLQLKEEYPDRDILGLDCGDIVGDKPELYPLYIEQLNRAGIPFYRMQGNHDLQFERLDPEVEKAYSDKENLEFGWIAPELTDHLFRATPLKRDSKITITAEDPFGNIYRETIAR